MGKAPAPAPAPVIPAGPTPAELAAQAAEEQRVVDISSLNTLFADRETLVGQATTSVDESLATELSQANVLGLTVATSPEARDTRISDTLAGAQTAEQDAQLLDLLDRFPDEASTLGFTGEFAVPLGTVQEAGTTTLTPGQIETATQGVRTSTILEPEQDETLAGATILG